MSAATMAFLYLAVAASGGALAFLAGQRAAGKTPKEVHACNEQATLLESVSRDLDALHDEAAKAEIPEPAHEEIKNARARLEEAITGLRKGADLIV